MNKKTIEKIATFFLILIFILVSISSYKKIKRSVSPAKPVGPGQNIEQLQGSLPSLNVGLSRKPVGNKVYKNWGRDPFSGFVYSAQGEDIALRFTGVLWDSANPKALINDEIIGNNSIVGKYKVIKINKESVILNDGVKDLELRLGQ